MIVEFFGMARVLAGAPNLDIGGERMTAGQLIVALAERCPAMVGDVIAADRQTFVLPNMLLLDGRRAPADNDTFVTGDRPCVLFLASGG